MKNNLLQIIIIGIFLTLLGCNTAQEVQKKGLLHSSTPQFQTEQSPISATASMSETPIKTLTPTVSKNDIPISTPHPTLISTLPSDDMEKVITGLFRDNNRCELPCWWGMVPGKTDWESVKTFSAQFDKNISEKGGEEKDQTLNIHIRTKNSIPMSSSMYLDIQMESGIIKTMNIYDFEWPSYHLSQFLIQNGKPDEIWVYTLKSNLGGTPPFELMLYYPNKGIFASFFGLDKTFYKDGYVNACTSYSPGLILWSPNKEMTFQEILKIRFGDFVSFHPVLPIMEATGMNVEKFFQKYKNPDNPPCFQTNQDLWPEP